MPSPRRVALNARLLYQSALQHAVDDPALLVVQVSHRLPIRLRIAAGKLLWSAAESSSRAIPSATGAAALGAYMAGATASAQSLITGECASDSRIGGEVAVLFGRSDLLSSRAIPATRARAAWSRGALSEALEILCAAGQGSSRYANRLRSELRLLEPGYRLESSRTIATKPPSLRDGERVRVLHILTNSLPHTQSGYSLRSHRILTALRGEGVDSLALTRTGYPVMLGKPFAAEEDVVDGVRYARTLPGRVSRTQEDRLLAEVERALELVAQFRPHVIHATTNYYNALVAQAVSAATGVPWILEVRGLMEKTWIASHANDEARVEAAASEKVRLVAAREGELAAEADAVVTLSDTMLSELVERGVDPGALTVVPNGVDETLLSGHVDQLSARTSVGLDVGEGAFLVGAVSAMVDYEGFDTLLRAVAILLEDPRTDPALRDRVHVVLAGDGIVAPELRALAEDLGISERVIMPGRVRREAARNWVQALDVVIVPRHDVEVARMVTPQKPVEAMALGRPVIVSDLPALRETVSSRDGGISAGLVPPGNARALADSLIEASGAPESMERRVDRGLQIARARTWTTLVRRYGAIYRDSLGRLQDGSSRDC